MMYLKIIILILDYFINFNYHDFFNSYAEDTFFIFDHYIPRLVSKSYKKQAR